MKVSQKHLLFSELTDIQYFSGPVFMTVSILVNNLNKCFVEHLLEPAMKAVYIGSDSTGLWTVDYYITVG